LLSQLSGHERRVVALVARTVYMYKCKGAILAHCYITRSGHASGCLHCVHQLAVYNRGQLFGNMPVHMLLRRVSTAGRVEIALLCKYVSHAEYSTKLVVLTMGP
jgi:hypothetical protein